VVVDDSSAKLSGQWKHSTSQFPYVGAGYQHDDAAGKKESATAASATFIAKLPQPGRYDVRIAYSPNPNRASNVKVVVKHAIGIASTTINQQKTPPIDGTFTSIGAYAFESEGTVTISNEAANGHVIIDAVQFLPLPPKP
jgi:hypothetical protein